MDQPPPTPRQTSDAQREARRAAELRENLRKRKAQAQPHQQNTRSDKEASCP